MAETPEEEVERLIGIFEASYMRTLHVVTPTLELYLSREADSGAPEAVRGREAPPDADRAAQAVPAGSPAPPDDAVAGGGGHLVRAPMVGTVYRAPEPGKPAFVEVGDHVQQEDTVLLVEAMKVFTSVTAGIAGIVEEIYVADAQSVEYDQVMLRIAPDGDAAAGDHGTHRSGAEAGGGPR